jgi:hypothetical protein
MKWLSVVCVILPLAWALRDDTYFMACPLQATTGSGTGIVACVMGVTSTNQTVQCAFQYAGLTGDISGAEIRQTSGRVGQLINFANAVSGIPTVYKRDGGFNGLVMETVKYRAAQTMPVTPQVDTETWPANAFNASFGDFTTTMANCFNDITSCVVTITTSANQLSCEFGYLTFGASFDFPLAKNTLTSNANGYAWLDWFVAGQNPMTDPSVWAYAVDYYALSAPVSYAGLFDGLGPFPSLSPGPATVVYDVTGAAMYGLTTGTFVGVAIQGQPWFNISAANNYPFLVNCSIDHCYVGVQSLPGTMELRGQLIAGVGHVIPSLVTLLAMLIAAVSHRHL